VDQAKKILVVDDEKGIRFIIKNQLESNGFEVVEAEDGSNVVERIETDQIALVILDVMMDGKEGVQTLIDIRERYADIPVLMISSEEVYLQLVVKFGASEILAKPIELSVLQQKVNALLNLQ